LKSCVPRKIAVTCRKYLEIAAKHHREKIVSLCSFSSAYTTKKTRLSEPRRTTIIYKKLACVSAAAVIDAQQVWGVKSRSSAVRALADVRASGSMILQA
jgi:hypothetical protein